MVCGEAMQAEPGDTGGGADMGETRSCKHFSVLWNFSFGICCAAAAGQE